MTGDVAAPWTVDETSRSSCLYPDVFGTSTDRNGDLFVDLYWGNLFFFFFFEESPASSI